MLSTPLAVCLYAEADGRIAASLDTLRARVAVPSHACCPLLPRRAPRDPSTGRSPVKAEPLRAATGCRARRSCLTPGAAALTGPQLPGALAAHEPGGAGRTDREAWTRHPSAREEVPLESPSRPDPMRICVHPVS